MHTSRTGNIFSAVVNSDTGALDEGPLDFFYIKAPRDARVRIRECRLGQYSADVGGATDVELLGVEMMFHYRIKADGTYDTGGAASADDTGNPLETSIHMRHEQLTRSSDTGARDGDTGDRSLVKVLCRDLATDTGGDTGITVWGRTLVSDVWNLGAGWWYYPPLEECPIIEPGQALSVRVSAAPSPFTVNGTLVYEEIGTRGGSS